MENHKEIEKIDIMTYVVNFLKAVKKFWLWMLIGTVALTALFFVRSQMSYTPMYQSQITFTVNSGSSSMLSGSSTEQVRESLPYILNSSYMKNMVMDDLELSWFPASISFESREYVEFFVLKVTAGDAQMAYDVLNSIIENCPKASVYVLGQITLNILDASGVATAPFNTVDKTGNLLKGVVLGIFISMGFAFIYTLTTYTIRDEAELKKYVSAPCLASLPQISFKRRRKTFDKHIHIHNDKVGYAFLENIRILRSRVQRSMEQLEAKVIVVTSSIPKEGKSMVAANLALSFAETGARVILVDLDLRNPSVEGTLGDVVKKKNGVSQFLKGTEKLEICNIKKWNLSVISTEPVTDNPIDLLEKEQCGKMIEILREKYDYVVIDTPPAAILSDVAIVAKHADAALYVVKQDYARIERVVEGMEALNLVQVPIIGVVLNGVETVLGAYGSYRYGNYGVYGEYKAHSGDGSESEMEYVDLENPWEQFEDFKKE